MLSTDKCNNADDVTLSRLHKLDRVQVCHRCRSHSAPSTHTSTAPAGRPDSASQST